MTGILWYLSGIGTGAIAVCAFAGVIGWIAVRFRPDIAGRSIAKIAMGSKRKKIRKPRRARLSNSSGN